MVRFEKNILLVSYYFAPNKIVGAKRISYLSYYLSQKGFQVYVLTIKQKYNPQIDNALPKSEKIYRVRMFPPFPIIKKTIFHRIFKVFWEKLAAVDPYGGWIIPAIIKGIIIIKKHSITQIIATGPPFSSFFISFVLSKVTGVKLILDYRDPWFLYSFGSTERISYKINFWLEEIILKRADRIVFNTEKARDEYIKQKNIKSLREKSLVIKNAIPSCNGNNEPIKLENNKKVILYAGNFYGTRSFQYLIEPLQKLFHENELNPEKISIHAFGKVPLKDKELLAKQNLTNILHEHKKVNSDDIIRYMKGADILYLPQGEEVKYSIAFKFYDYLSARKPILALAPKDSAIAEIVNETSCGELADMENTEEIYLALKNILVYEKQYEFKGLEKFTWEKMSDQFFDIIHNSS